MQRTFVEELIVAVSSRGWFIITEVVAVHRFASVTVNVYVPTGRLLAVTVFPTCTFDELVHR
jgi:hypothetical protein